jgi:WD40 repeat protein
MGGVILPPSPNWYGAHLCDFEAPAYAFCAQNAIVVLDSRRMAVTSILRGHGNRTTALTFIKSDSRPLWIVSAASDNTLRFWVCVDDTRLAFACRRALSKRPSEIRAIVNVCRTDGMALFGDQAGNLFRCTVGVGAKLEKLDGCRRSSPVICLAAVSLVTANGQECDAAAVGCESGEISLIDWKMSCILSTLHTHTNEIHCLRWMSGLLLSSSMDKSLRIHKVEVTDFGSAGECEECTSVTWDELTHIELPKPPENATSSQKSRLWFTSEWFGWHLEMMKGQDGLPPTLWVLGSSYGGAILAWKVSLPESTERLAYSVVQPPIKLPATHARTIFSIRCQIDTSLSGQPGVQILTP